MLYAVLISFLIESVYFSVCPLNGPEPPEVLCFRVVLSSVCTFMPKPRYSPTCLPSTSSFIRGLGVLASSSGRDCYS